jgi:hypothetical protein
MHTQNNSPLTVLRIHSLNLYLLFELSACLYPTFHQLTINTPDTDQEVFTCSHNRATRLCAGSFRICQYWNMTYIWRKIIIWCLIISENRLSSDRFIISTEFSVYYDQTNPFLGTCQYFEVWTAQYSYNTCKILWMFVYTKPPPVKLGKARIVLNYARLFY